MVLFRIIPIGLCLLCTQTPFRPVTSQITTGGMTLEWTIRPQTIRFTIIAPTQGWMAIGLNKEKGLKNTNLIMGYVDQDSIVLDDRFILRPGMHKSVEDLGGISHISNIAGQSSSLGSTIHFDLKRDTRDPFHFDLIPDTAYEVLLAYSIDKDFQHHSVMRTHLKIIL